MSITWRVRELNPPPQPCQGRSPPWTHSPTQGVNSIEGIPRPWLVQNITVTPHTSLLPHLLAEPCHNISPELLRMSITDVPRGGDGIRTRNWTVLQTVAFTIQPHHQVTALSIYERLAGSSQNQAFKRCRRPRGVLSKTRNVSACAGEPLTVGNQTPL